MHSFAQTNIQLYNQLGREGYVDADVDLILDTYSLAMNLFTGYFRPSGKTFIAHLVGTASILASLRVSAKIVAAGLIHAAYEAGDFGDNTKGVSDAKRVRVRSVVGDEVEQYVARYSGLMWSTQLLAAYCDQLDGAAAVEREVFLMRLANELEEYLDLGILYCGPTKRESIDYMNQRGQMLIAMAQRLGFPVLAASLARAFEEAIIAKVPRAAQRPNGWNRSFVLAPQSCQRVMDALAKRMNPVPATGSPASKVTDERR